MGRITDVTDWNNHKTTYNYDKNNRIVKTTNWNDSTENRTYDKSGQLVNISTKNADTTIDSHDYTYDAEGNLTKDNTQSYSYDSLNRLTSGLSTYQYSITGNIEKSNTHNYTYGNDNRLSSIDNKSTSVDSAGNLTSYTENNKSHTATYNSQNELTKYDNSSYTYDANGNRVSQNDVNYTYDTSGNLITDSNHEYIYGPNGLIGYYHNDKFYTNIYNNRGDVTKILDESSDTVSSINYGDYGNITSKTGNTDTPFLYAGQGGAVTDSNGLVYLKTRYYNPELMRFMNRDTVSGSITEPQSLNRYTYVQGNPLTYVDLTGQSRTFVTVGNIIWFGAGFLPIAGSITAVADLINDLSQAPVDNTTMLLDLAGVGAGLIGGRGIETGTSDSLKLIKQINTSKLQKAISKLASKTKPAFAGFSEEQTAKESGKMVNARDEYRLANTPELSNGGQYTKSGRMKVLKKNIHYESNGYHYSTDNLGRITTAKGQLQKAKAKRNPYTQRVAGREDRLPTDDGGHLFASRFNGSGDLDNIIAQARNINRSGGEWYNLETEWANALNNNQSVYVKTRINYTNTSLRPSSFDVKYIIDGNAKAKHIIN